MTSGGLTALASLLAGAGALGWPGRPRPVLPSGPRSVPPPSSARLVLDADLLLTLVEMVSVQVRAGASPTAAWRAAVDVLGLGPAGDVADPSGWLVAAGRQLPAARAAAAGWRLAERTGAPLSDVLDGVAGALRDESALAADVEAALAGPRATVRLLMVLPVGAVLLGQLIGADPVRVLTTTGPGRVCALAGLLLLGLGRWWMAHLVRRVGRGR
ncbi:type II secretion system F family protein [Angustibacter sp. McL0619]|uniref:type II secretion system F family protein n=1 Tax=Angustibacter sp. McL0619 TaxID=3415676 RepID=UPI003CF36F0C